ncbi:MAG: serine protease [Polyangiales bacterium]
MPPRPHAASPTPLQNPAPAPVKPPAPAPPPAMPSPAMPSPAMPSPAPSPAMPSPSSFGAQRVDRGATLAVHMDAPPGAPASPGQAAASALPQGAHVGRRTVALMIDEALQRARREQPSGNRGLKALVLVFALLAAAGTGTAAWLLLDEDRAPRRSSPVAGPSGDASNIGARIAAANEANVYILAIERGNALRGFCTGFAVTPTLIATNAHCVHNATDEIARGGRLVALRNKSPGARLAARPAYADARFRDRRFSSGGNGYDVGLVRVDSRMPGQVRLATDAELSALHEGDAIFVYGFPGMTMNVASPVATITLGLLNRVTDFFDGVATPATAQKLQHSAQTSGGSSGSAIFTPNGSVIGLNAGSLADDERQVVVDPNNGQRREVEVNRGSNFKYGMRADLIRQGIASLGERVP